MVFKNSDFFLDEGFVFKDFFLPSGGGGGYFLAGPPGAFLDPPRDDTKDTIQRSEDYGVPVRPGPHRGGGRGGARDVDVG